MIVKLFNVVLIMALFQILALLPGISRSGITISILLMLGVNMKEAVKFSFLMAIPLILVYLIGPIGLFIYWVIRIFYAKKMSLYE